MFWYDTGNGVVKQRNSTNTAWITLWEEDSHYPSLESGTKMVFYQASAPTGWTQDVTQNDKALRVVSSSGGGSGGSLALSSANVGSTTLSTGQIPSHAHNYGGDKWGGSLGHLSGANVGETSSIATSSTGGGSSHDHSLALAYVDVIIATKD